MRVDGAELRQGLLRSFMISMCWRNLFSYPFSVWQAAGGMGEVASRSRDELLESRIGELVECWIGVRCLARCHHSAFLPLKLLAAKHGGHVLLRSVIQRLRCQVCATPPGEAWLTDHPISDSAYGGVHATWAVGLVP